MSASVGLTRIRLSSGFSLLARSGIALQELFVIGLEVVAEEREAEAAAALKAAVAAAAVAAQAAEQRADVPLKAGLFGHVAHAEPLGDRRRVRRRQREADELPSDSRAGCGEQVIGEASDPHDFPPQASWVGGSELVGVTAWFGWNGLVSAGFVPFLHC